MAKQKSKKRKSKKTSSWVKVKEITVKSINIADKFARSANKGLDRIMGFNR